MKLYRPYKAKQNKTTKKIKEKMDTKIAPPAKELLAFDTGWEREHHFQE